MRCKFGLTHAPPIRWSGQFVAGIADDFEVLDSQTKTANAVLSPRNQLAPKFLIHGDSPIICTRNDSRCSGLHYRAPKIEPSRIAAQAVARRREPCVGQ